MISILTFNILADQFINFNELEVDYPSVNPELLKERDRIPKIMSILEDVQSDIILLQEVNLKVFRILKKEFSEDYEIWPLVKHKSRVRYGNLTMVRKGLLRNAGQRVILSESTGTSFSILEDSKYVIFNLHLDASEHENKRRIEMGIIGKILSEISPEKIIIVGGDFNTENKYTHRGLPAYGLRSAIGNKKGTYLAEKECLDYIYVKGSKIVNSYILRPGRVTSDTALDLYGSDHFPVYASIDL